jgi:hypothetical protein
MNIRFVVQTHLMRDRLDVLLSVLAPLVLMLESGYANAWVFAGGHLGFDFPSLMALGRGIFLEALIFACFKLVKMFVSKGRWSVAFAFIPLAVGSMGMIVSAGCNLGWMANSPEMHSTLSIVSQLMPEAMANIFRVGLGLLFPVAVGVFALFDVSHLVEEMLKSSHLDNRAIVVHRSEMHRTNYLKSLKRAGEKVKKEYDAIAETDAHNMVAKVRSGDMTFGSAEVAQSAQSSVTKLSPTRVQPVPQPMIGGPGIPGFPPMPSASMSQSPLYGTMPQAQYPQR